METNRLALPSVQGGSEVICTKESNDLGMESRPIPNALLNDPPKPTNDKPQESQEMVLLKAKKELKEKQKLEKQKMAQFQNKHLVKAMAKVEVLEKKHTTELMNAKLESLWSRSYTFGCGSLNDRHYFE
jgi:hypothetical protein